MAAKSTNIDVESNLSESKGHHHLSPVESSDLVFSESTVENSNHGSQMRSMGKLQRAEAWLDRKMGIETQGIDRIREEDKVPPSVWNMFLLWWSFTCHVGALPLGMLGPEFGLTFYQSASASLIGAFLGSICTASCATLGPKLGLRAMATARYSFGFYGAKVCSLLNIIIGAGFATVNVVVVGQLLSAVSEYKLSLSVGCILIGVISYLVSLFGFKIIHTYEKYAWIFSFLILCILGGQIGRKVDTSLPSTQSGLANIGAFLSFATINFSATSAWGSIAADYLCNYPANTPKWKIYLLTVSGIVTSTFFTVMIGICLGNIAHHVTSEPGAKAETYAHPILAEAYQRHGLGGLLSVSYHPVALSKVILILLTFSVIGNNVAVNYSSGLSIQLLGDFFHAIPRFIWSFLNGFIITVLAVLGRESLSVIVANFVSMLGYWTISFTLILAIEDRVFRRRSGYDLDVWDTSSKLPHGMAAILALLISYLAGGLSGMAQSLYTGPIARKFGGDGGDVGIFLSGVITLIVYPIARYYEFQTFLR
ncbi:Purine-cytosine permease FCY21 [Golovinomyces cichoracearum]|uniref:Purine-cytosine permease FCY21 n=1 Tax=Golovinomyces cichoracearum TaxID=62708 RepID=A0A420J6A6_9PEZI|nr:Purine-cytosine permease FCY21 [Golovinomyces cichoracearum]